MYYCRHIVWFIINIGSVYAKNWTSLAHPGEYLHKINLPVSILTHLDFPHILKLIYTLQLHVIFWYFTNIFTIKEKNKKLENQKIFKVTDLATKISSPIWARRFEINWSAGKIRSPRSSGRVLTYTLIGDILSYLIRITATIILGKLLNLKLLYPLIVKIYIFSGGAGGGGLPSSASGFSFRSSMKTANFITN